MDSKSVLENIRDYYDSLFAAEKKVADYILNNPNSVISTNVSELAELSGASDATVIRMCKRVGYEGFYQMKIKLSHDIGQNRAVQLEEGKKDPENIKDIFQVIISNLMYTSEQLDIKQILSCVNLIKNSKTVYVIATGNTIPVAMDMAYRLNKLGIRAISNVIAEYFLNNISLASEEDLVIGISHSGSSKHVIQALELAKERSVKTIVITNSDKSPIAHLADNMLCTRVRNPMFENDDYRVTSHLYEMAIVDTLLYFIVKADSLQEKIDKVELLLSEFKL